MLFNRSALATYYIDLTPPSPRAARRIGAPLARVAPDNEPGRWPKTQTRKGRKMEVTITIKHAENYDTLDEAIVSEIDSDSTPTSLVEIGMPESPVYVDSENTPIQSAGATLDDVIDWLHGAGRLPCQVYYSGRLYTIASPADYDPGAEGWGWITDSEDVEVDIEWPDELPHDSCMSYDLDALKRLVAWARECDAEIDGNLRKMAQDVIDAFA